MASTRQLKQRARFHAAVLRHFFPPPSPGSHQETPEVVQEVNFQVEYPRSTELVIEETHTDGKEVEVGKSLLSRAQRKRFKTQKLKETQSNPLPAKRFVGPLLPYVLEKRRLHDTEGNSADALLQENMTIDTGHIFSSSSCDQDFKELGKPEVLSTITGEELSSSTREVAISSLLETGKGKDVHDKVELEILSRVKKRRLAKKKFHNSSRCPTAGLSFTAEMKGEDIIIKPVL